MRAAATIQPLKEHQVMQPRHAQTMLQLHYHAQITSMGRIMAMACHAVIAQIKRLDTCLGWKPQTLHGCPETTALIH
jgi:hypothetical protein